MHAKQYMQSITERGGVAVSFYGIKSQAILDGYGQTGNLVINALSPTQRRTNGQLQHLHYMFHMAGTVRSILSVLAYLMATVNPSINWFCYCCCLHK